MCSLARSWHSFPIYIWKTATLFFRIYCTRPRITPHLHYLSIWQKLKISNPAILVFCNIAHHPRFAFSQLWTNTIYGSMMCYKRAWHLNLAFHCFKGSHQTAFTVTSTNVPLYCGASLNSHVYIEIFSLWWYYLEEPDSLLWLHMNWRRPFKNIP